MAAPARIDIDGYNLALHQGTGVATYGRNLSAALGQIGASTSILYGLRMDEGAEPLLKEIHFFDAAKMTKGKGYLNQVLRVTRSLFGGVRAFEIPITGKVEIGEFAPTLPRFDRILNADSLFRIARDYFKMTGKRLEVTVPDPPQIMHWTYPVPVKVKGAKNIYTLHDLVPLRLPHTTLDNKESYLSLMKLLAREADHLVTVSEASRRDIIDLLGVPEDRVTNTYQAVDLPAQVLAAADAELGKTVERALGLTEHGYFLFVGAIEPKKNIRRLVEGYLAAQPRAKLVIVGKKAWKWEEDLALAALIASGPDAPIIHLDYLPFPTLLSLIRGAKAVVFPSLYEGFGLPVLEALQLGAPVITANTGSLPEVAGDAAVMVDPYDSASIAAAIRRLDTDADLRAQLSARGKAQAATFSAAVYQERLKALYRGLGAEV